MRVVLTIAGFDPSNGAGVTADLQVFAAHGLFGVSAITALTVQSTLGVAAVEPVAAATLRHMLRHLAADVHIEGVKIGMLGSRDAVIETASFLRELRAEHGEIPIVLDPVLRSTSGAGLLTGEGVDAMRSELLGQAMWITPNWTELGALAGSGIGEAQDVEKAMRQLGARFPRLHIVATGGDASGDAVDMWRSPEGAVRSFRGARVETQSTHGTGCAFSSALLSRLVLGAPAEDAVAGAKEYVRGGLMRAPGIGQGRGPLDLLWPLRASSPKA